MIPLRLRADLTIVVISLIWGTTFVVVKAALADVSTLLFLALRFSFASALLFAVFRPRLDSAGLRPSRLLAGCLCGVFLFLGYALQTAGLRYTTASNSAFLTGLFVVFVPLLSTALRRARIHAAECAGCLLALSGTVLLTGITPSSSFNPGDLLTLGCAVAYSAHIIAVSHFSPRLDHEWLSFLQVATVALLSLATFFWIEVPRVVWTHRLFWALLATGALATALSFSLYTWAQRHTSATRAALLFALEPVFAALTAIVFAGERWTLGSLAGAALILSAILLIELRPSHPSANPELS